jgi:hypothetical protein
MARRGETQGRPTAGSELFRKVNVRIAAIGGYPVAIQPKHLFRGLA